MLGVFIFLTIWFKKWTNRDMLPTGSDMIVHILLEQLTMDLLVSIGVFQKVATVLSSIYF